MDTSLRSVKSYLDAACDKYYLEEMLKKKASEASEKPEPQKTMAAPEKDSESSTKEAKKERSTEKPTSSTDNPPKRSVKKGKRVLRKSGDPKVPPSEEVACATPSKESARTPSKEVARATPSKEFAHHEPLKKVDELSAGGGEEENPTNLFNLNISEEAASYNRTLPSDDAASRPSEKKADSRSPSCSSGDVPLKKRKIEAGFLLVKNVEVAENKEAINSALDEKNQGSIADAGDHQEVLATSSIILIPENVAAADVKTAHSDEIDESSADVKAKNKEDVDSPLRPLNNFPPTDPITISEEHPAAAERQEISHEEFQAFRSEMARLKEEVVRLRGDSIDVNRGSAIVNKELQEIHKELAKINKELATINKELARVKATGGRKSEDFMNGGFCLLQKLVCKGMISPEEALNPSLWN